jgi:uncharacterized membrane protein
MRPPSAGPYLSVLALVVSVFGTWTVRKFELRFWSGLAILICSFVALVVVYVVHWRRTLIKRKKEDDAKEERKAKEAQEIRQAALEAEIREEKRRLDERIRCEGPSCTTGWWEGRTSHTAAKRDMWDLDGKAVSKECFRSAMGRSPIPGKDKLAFPPRSFAAEAEAEALLARQKMARNRYQMLEALEGSEDDRSVTIKREKKFA